MDGSYERLIVEIIELAIKDYKNARIKLKKKPNDISATKMLNDCERFFLIEMDNYADVVKLDGQFILNTLKKMSA